MELDTSRTQKFTQCPHEQTHQKCHVSNGNNTGVLNIVPPQNGPTSTEFQRIPTFSSGVAVYLPEWAEHFQSISTMLSKKNILTDPVVHVVQSRAVGQSSQRCWAPPNWHRKQPLSVLH